MKTFSVVLWTHFVHKWSSWRSSRSGCKSRISHVEEIRSVQLWVTSIEHDCITPTTDKFLSTCLVSFLFLSYTVIDFSTLLLCPSLPQHPCYFPHLVGSSSPLLLVRLSCLSPLSLTKTEALCLFICHPGTQTTLCCWASASLQVNAGMSSATYCRAKGCLSSFLFCMCMCLKSDAASILCSHCVKKGG